MRPSQIMLPVTIHSDNKEYGNMLTYSNLMISLRESVENSGNRKFPIYLEGKSY